MKRHYRTLDIPGGKAPVHITYQGSQHPLVCLRSLLAALGLAWRSWWPLCVQVCDLHGWPLLPARDVQGRPSSLLAGRQAPRFLAALAPQVARTHPAGGTRLATAAAQLGTKHFEVPSLRAANTPPKTPQNAPSDSPRASGPAGTQNGHSGRFAPLPKKPAATITREVESEALALAAQGQSRAAIARCLGISKSTASLLTNGKYKFAAEQAARPRLADAEPMRHARTGAPTKITADTGRQVLALYAQGYAQAEVARRLSVSRATVNLIVHGKYQFAQGA